MACPSNYPYSEYCTNREGDPIKGAPGRSGVTPKAFVIHKLPVTMEQYAVELERDLLITQLFQNPPVPRSVHAVFGPSGAWAGVVNRNTPAWGLNGLVDPTAAAQAVITQDPTHPEKSLIHLAFDSQGPTPLAVSSMAEAMCCWAIEFGITLSAATVLDAVEFNSNETLLGGIPMSLLQQSLQCVAAGGPLPRPDPVPTGFAVIISDLQRCCRENTAALTALTLRVDTLETKITQMQTTLTTLQGFVTQMQQSMVSQSTISAIMATIGLIQDCLNDYKACLKKLCPAVCPPTDCYDIYYTWATGRMVQIPQNVETVLDFSVKVDDAPLDDAQVLTGPVWNAHLTCECQWRAEVGVQIAMRKWCAGDKVWITMVVNGVRTRVAEWTAPTNGSAAPSVATVAPVVIPVPPTADVQFYIGHDAGDPDQTEVIGGYVKISC